MGSISVALSHSGVPDEAVVEEMIRAAPHRGGRIKMIQHGSASLAVAASEDRDDAHLGVDGDVAVVLAGTVDNIRDVAREAERAGQAPQSLEPADILMAAYRAFGIDLPARLRGVFGGVVSDRARIMAFRDHLGFAPVFFGRDARGVRVASEAKQVVAGAGVGEEPDLDVCEEIYFQTYDEHTPSALRGVERLPRGSVLLADGSGARLRRYWDPTDRFESGHYGPEEIKERFDHLMGQAVARTLTGQDAVSLSGGIDSPAVAAYGASRHLEMAGRPLGGVSAAYPDFPAVDESEYTRLVADDLGMPLHLYQQHARPLDRLDEWTRLTDGPVPWVALPQYEEHYRLVRSLGYRSVLSGEFAEFVFDISTYLIPYLVWHGRWGAVARLLGDRRARGGSWASVLRSLANPFVPTRVTAYRWARSRTNVPMWLDRRRVNEPAVKSIVPIGERWAKVQLSPFFGVSPTMEADDVCQQLCGLVCRRPWADVDLWEFFLSLPAEVKFPDTRGKTLVRGLLRGRVPDPILDRRDKTYFDDSVRASIDYPTLRRWLTDPPHRLKGVRYDLLRERLDGGTLELSEFRWAKDLASVHAFLSRWE
jgi:asparagine synthetase B (glutamine-hydrolysing)